MNVSRCAILLGWLTAGVGFAFAAEPAATVAERVVILANSREADSVRLARYYAERRAVPPANIVALPMSPDETIEWAQFVDEIHRPLLEELVKRGWIDAIVSTETDRVGRKKYAVSGHRIAYLVVCRGVPLRIAHDPERYSEERPFARQPEFRTNRGAVDAELAVLAQGGSPIDGVISNPLFRNDRASFIEENAVIKVARLDGPDYADAAALVDRALAAEKHGLIGRAYVDLGGPHPDGDNWLAEVVRQIDELAFDGAVDRAREVFAASVRFDAPVLYFGWYTGALSGPFLRPEFRFPPGAIALHIHSFSASTLRSAHVGWCGPMVARGVTATFGNVYEPYLPLTHHPQLLLRALASGKTLGDAAFFALPALSWQDVVIGDPLYRPFAVSFGDQWERRGELPDDAFPYVVLRELRILEQGGQIEEAIATVTRAFEERPGLVLALRLAELCESAGRSGEAAAAVAAILPLRSARPDEVAIAAALAEFCVRNAEADRAVEIYRALLESKTLFREDRLALLRAAPKAAEAAGNDTLAAQWSRERAAVGARPSRSE